ncbi:MULTISPECIES: hypothetical protein [Chryseobacterium]|uniref:hypothetical protein n=1 Tax=Chryseobacterium TaxID=59732 RepID=UPI001BEBCF74|nr:MULTISPECIES: hypothetical protein [Chryseobacterium]MBT2621512.1 hypothetical protein [Chryseobacterium sp. ISL-6]
MKTSLKNQYTITNQILIAVVSSVLGYNIYQAIVNPERSHLILSLLLIMMTYIMVEKYDSNKQSENESE